MIYMIQQLLLHSVKFFLDYIFPYIEYVISYTKKIYLLCTYSYQEPVHDEWKCLIYISNNEYMEYYFSYELRPYDTKWGLWIYKLKNGMYIYNNADMYGETQENIYEKSNVYFLSIKLQQGNNCTSIHIKKNEYIEKNTLLSYLYIVRYMKYNKHRFDMDKPYTITLFDNKLKTNIIHKNQYIILGKDTYMIHD